MPSPTVVQTRLDNISTCLALAVGTLDDLSDAFGTPFLSVISNTVLSLITAVKGVKRNKDECTELMENIHQIIYAIVHLHIKAEPQGELQPAMLHYIGKFTEYFTFTAFNQN
ncbi:hypothetical protein FB451DRAFT_1410208 [Mycena latifolia]|nr:hypothetical protein FB451DRAFT_1410208 [Mycena latifolia]